MEGERGSKFTVIDLFSGAGELSKGFLDTENTKQRYYLLSTVAPNEDDRVAIDEMIYKIREEHGCQIIVNGVFPTLKYYLRLLDNTDVFVEKYIKKLSENTEINFEHKIAWNKVCERK